MLHRRSIRFAGTCTTRAWAFWQAAVGQELTRIEHHPEYHGALLPHQQQIGLLVSPGGLGDKRVCPVEA